MLGVIGIFFIIMLFSPCRSLRFTVRRPLARFMSSLGDNVGPTLESPQSPLPKIMSELSILEFRVGKVVSVVEHPEADGLYVEQIDLGEASGPRTIVSGLAKFLTIPELSDRLVVVLCNLKPRMFKGISSPGMLMCVSNESHTKVDPIAPPVGAAIGQLISFPGHALTPVEAGNKATKAFGKILEGFHSDENGIATYKGIPFMTDAGPVKASLKGKIS